MNTVVKIALLSIMLNLASGIIMIGVLDSEGDQVFDIASTGGMRYDSNYANNISEIENLQEPINPAGTAVEDAGDRVYRVLDMMSLGFVYRFISNIESLMFGFVNLLKVTIGQYMAENLSNMLFGKDELHGIFHLILTIGYILVGIQMFTGKNITGEQ